MAQKIPVIGFVGLDAIGGAICRNIALKHHGEILAFDAEPAAFSILEGTKARRADSVAEVGAEADIVFLFLSCDLQIEEICLGEESLTSGARRPSVIVDLGGTTVDMTYSVAERLVALWVRFADAPVAYVHDVLTAGQANITVGADRDLYTYIEPLLHYFSSNITHCGDIGCGQMAKLISNALAFEHTVALAEMMVIGKRAGVNPSALLDAVSKSAGDSFALRNQGRTSMLSREFPETIFPPEYALKELGYVIDLAWQVDIVAHMALLAERYYAATISNGWSKRYYPAVIDIIDRNIEPMQIIDLLSEGDCENYINVHESLSQA